MISKTRQKQKPQEFEAKLQQLSTNSAFEAPAWDEKTELKFQNALDSIDKKYGHALKNLADI